MKKEKKRCLAIAVKQNILFYMTIAQQVREPQANCTANAEEHNKRVTFYKNAVCLMALIFTLMPLAFAKSSNAIRAGQWVYVVCNPLSDFTLTFVCTVL